MTEENQGMNRRRMLQGLGAVGLLAGAATVVGASVPAQAETLPRFTPRGKLKRRPNFLVVVVDEQRHAPVYESAALTRWREDNLPSQNFLRSKGMSFDNHHIMASACAPSRASFFTGQYPSLHGVTQTSGIAKSAVEEDLYWLDPTTVPTMGAWFRSAGYDTFYKGKWHVSDADLYQPGSFNALPSYDDNGLADPRLEQVYLEANRLGAYGFDGWVGPEPHGSNPLNSGSSGPGGRGRDRVYARQGAELLKDLKDHERPWLVVTSFVDPHDIVLWGELSLATRNLYLAQQLQGSNVPRDLFTDDYDVTSNEDLSLKPTAQASYRDTYPLALQPTNNNTAYHRFYYQLQKNVDENIAKVLDALQSDAAEYRDTVVIYLSDHGELLGSHGGMFQKWHVAYDEVLRVPFVFHNPRLFPTAESTNMLTSHADLLPTMLGLAGLDEETLRGRLRESHTQVRKLPGRDLSGFLLGEVTENQMADAPVYFMTDDEPMRGQTQVAWNGTMYPAVASPANLETVVVNLPTGAGGAKERWKYTRYFDNTDFWSSPGSKDVQTIVSGNVNQGGSKTATTTVKVTNPRPGQTGPAPDQIEVYNLTQDPLEQTNLAKVRRYRSTVAELKALLKEQAAKKRLTPTQQPWSDGVPGRFIYS